MGRDRQGKTYKAIHLYHAIYVAIHIATLTLCLHLYHIRLTLGRATDRESGLMSRVHAACTELKMVTDKKTI